jgi:MoaA/NifB/PqqE/SkfB family radical SAM enzyme
VAFGGGEPLSVPHFHEILEILSAAGIAIKLETNGLHIDDATADRLRACKVECVQISVDGATEATHARVRPGSSFTAALAAIDRMAARGTAPQYVFVPNRLNIDEIVAAYDLAAAHGCGTFVTGPMMRLGRAAAAWDSLACDDAEWQRAAMDLRAHAARMAGGPKLSIYPWDILTELERRLESPQAMLLVVPNGKIKLLNALPFAPADLRRDTLAEAWRAYQAAWRDSDVADFIARCRIDPTLLRHANETWEMRPAAARADA